MGGREKFFPPAMAAATATAMVQTTKTIQAEAVQAVRKALPAPGTSKSLPGPGSWANVAAPSHPLEPQMVVRRYKPAERGVSVKAGESGQEGYTAISTREAKRNAEFPSRRQEEMFQLRW